MTDRRRLLALAAYFSVLLTSTCRAGDLAVEVTQTGVTTDFSKTFDVDGVRPGMTLEEFNSVVTLPHTVSKVAKEISFARGREVFHHVQLTTASSLVTDGQGSQHMWTLRFGSELVGSPILMVERTTSLPSTSRILPKDLHLSFLRKYGQAVSFDGYDPHHAPTSDFKMRYLVSKDGVVANVPARAFGDTMDRMVLDEGDYARKAPACTVAFKWNMLTGAIGTSSLLDYRRERTEADDRCVGVVAVAAHSENGFVRSFAVQVYDYGLAVSSALALDRAIDSDLSRRDSMDRPPAL